MMNNVALDKANRELARIAYQHGDEYVTQVYEQGSKSATASPYDAALVVTVPAPPYRMTDNFHDWYRTLITGLY